MNEAFPQNIAKIFKRSSYQYSNIIHVPRLCNCNAMNYYNLLGKVFVVDMRTISQFFFQSLLHWPVQSCIYLPVLTLIHHSSCPKIHIFSSCLYFFYWFLCLDRFDWALFTPKLDHLVSMTSIFFHKCDFRVLNFGQHCPIGSFESLAAITVCQNWI